MKVIIGQRTYETGDLARIELGEAHEVFKKTGIRVDELGSRDWREPGIHLAILGLALHRATPERSWEDIWAELDKASYDAIDFIPDESKTPEPPPPSGPVVSESASGPPANEPSVNGGDVSGSATLPTGSGSLPSSTPSPM